MRDPSPRQLAILAYVHAYHAEHGYPPTIRETTVHAGLRSSASTHAHLRALERFGCLEKRASGARCYWPIKGEA